MCYLKKKQYKDNHKYVNKKMLNTTGLMCTEKYRLFKKIKNEGFDQEAQQV